MSESLAFGLVAAYLLGLIAVSEIADRGGWLSRIGRHPLALGLALGVYATSFTLFGGVGYAARHGYTILGFYLGVSLSCLCIPLSWATVARLVQRHRLTSAADLLAFRFPSVWTGPVVTLVLLVGLLPYLSLQLRALDGGAELLGAGTWTRPGYVALLALFAATLGVRYAEPWTNRPGLLTTLALESIFKLVTTLIVGGAALSSVFGGAAGFTAHLDAHPEILSALMEPVQESGFVTVVVVSFIGAFLLPRQFHVAFVALPSPEGLRQTTWILPLLLGLLLLPLPVLLEAGRLHAPAGTAPDLYVMAWTERTSLRLVAFLGAVSASSAMVLVTTVALSGMVVTHLLLPLRQDPSLRPGQVRRLRQGVTVGLVILGVIADAGLSRVVPLVDLGLISFSVVAQLAPGVLAGFVWPRATGGGVVAGLVVGTLLLLGTTTQSLLEGTFANGPEDMRLFGSLTANVGVLWLVSLLGRPTVDERRAALATQDGLQAPGAAPRSVLELQQRIETALGLQVARQEVEGALARLGWARDEQRPSRLRRLVQVVEQQLSGMVGPLQARAAVSGQDDPGSVAAQLRVLEEQRPSHGDWVRIWLGGLLQELPDGVVVIDGSGEVLLWNGAAAQMIGVGADQVVGARSVELPEALRGLLREEPDVEVRVGDRLIRVRSRSLRDGGRLVVMTDLTEERALQAQLTHQARLSTVGRMSTGVAHEIRNPLTGLLMVAQNLVVELEDEDHRARLGLIVSEGQRIEAIVRSLLSFSRRPSEVPERLVLAEVVEASRRLMSLRRAARAWTIQVSVPETIEVRGFRGPLVQVLVNLLENAMQAGSTTACIEVVGTRVGDEVVLDVLDDGPGIEPGTEEMLFEPFFTTKDRDEGTGLGLWVSWKIIDSHGGTIGYDRWYGRTRFQIRLPAPAASSGPWG